MSSSRHLASLREMLEKHLQRTLTPEELRLLALSEGGSQTVEDLLASDGSADQKSN